MSEKMGQKLWYRSGSKVAAEGVGALLRFAVTVYAAFWFR